MQAKILLFYDSPHLLRSVYCKATHPNFPVIRNGAQFDPLLSTCYAEPPTEKDERRRIYFLRFHHLTAAKVCPRAVAAHRPPMTHRLHTAKRQELTRQKTPTSTPAESRACISENIPTFSQNTSTFCNFFSSVLFPHARRCAHSASFCFLPSPFTSELKTLNSKHLR